MDESLYNKLHCILSGRERDRGSYAPADVMESIVDDKIHRLLNWMADKSDELEGCNG